MTLAPPRAGTSVSTTPPAPVVVLPVEVAFDIDPPVLMGIVWVMVDDDMSVIIELDMLWLIDGMEVVQLLLSMEWLIVGIEVVQLLSMAVAGRLARLAVKLAGWNIGVVLLIMEVLLDIMELSSMLVI